MGAPVRERARRDAALDAAFAAEYDGPHDPRDALHWLTRPTEAGPTGSPPPASAFHAARARLYRPGVLPEDRDRLVAAAERIRADEEAARAALARARRALETASARRRRRSVRLGAAAGALLVGAGLVAALGPVAADAPQAPPTATERPAGLALDRLPEPWRLSSLVTRSGAPAGATTLRMNRSVTGASFLLVVACSAADRSFTVLRTEEDGTAIGPPLTGRCGRRALVPLGLERGVGRVLVQVRAQGDAPFAAAIVRRSEG